MDIQTENVSLVDVYEWAWTTVDHRVDGWPLMSSINPMLLLILGYFAMTHFGYKMMQTRQPWNINWILIIYNISIALFNAYIVLQFLVAAIRLEYTWHCDVTNSEATDEEEMRMVTAVYLYMISKPIEWLDTAFFIVRKKDRQLSALHIYHHSSIFFISWILSRWVSSGSTFFPMLLNSIIHVIMYGYYALSAMGPKLQKYLWWKRYLTIIQMIQFLMAMIHGVAGIVNGCAYTKWVQYMVVFYMISFLILFGMFYQQTYRTKLKQKREYSAEETNGDHVANGCSSPTHTPTHSPTHTPTHSPTHCSEGLRNRTVADQMDTDTAEEASNN